MTTTAAATNVASPIVSGTTPQTSSSSSSGSSLSSTTGATLAGNFQTFLTLLTTQLQRALDDAGLKTGNGGLQFSLRDQSSSGQDGNETGRNAQRLVIGDDETIPAAVAGRTYGRVLGSSSGVDIRV